MVALYRPFIGRSNVKVPGILSTPWNVITITRIPFRVVSKLRGHSERVNCVYLKEFGHLEPEIWWVISFLDNISEILKNSEKFRNFRNFQFFGKFEKIHQKNEHMCSNRKTDGLVKTKTLKIRNMGSFLENFKISVENLVTGWKKKAKKNAEIHRHESTNHVAKYYFLHNNYPFR